jgi:hypothetical protein
MKVTRKVDPMCPTKYGTVCAELAVDKSSSVHQNLPSRTHASVSSTKSRSRRTGPQLKLMFRCCRFMRSLRNVFNASAASYSVKRGLKPTLESTQELDVALSEQMLLAAGLQEKGYERVRAPIGTASILFELSTDTYLLSMLRKS